MTDYRNFRPVHDLRSQLGLAPLTDAQQSRMSKLDEALRFEPKPLDPAKAALKPNIIHMTVNSNDLPLGPAGQKIHDEIVRMLGKRGSVPNSIQVMSVDDPYTPPEKWKNLAEFDVAGTLAKGAAFEGRGRRHYEYLDVAESEDSINIMVERAGVCDGVSAEGLHAAKQKFAEAFSLLTKALHGQ